MLELFPVRGGQAGLVRQMMPHKFAKWARTATCGLRNWKLRRSVFAGASLQCAACSAISFAPFNYIFLKERFLKTLLINK